MRTTGFFILMHLLGAAPALAQQDPEPDWTEYIYPDRGFAIQFPAPPTITAGMLESSSSTGSPQASIPPNSTTAFTK